MTAAPVFEELHGEERAMGDFDDGGDEQDVAETFDETNITADGDDIAHPDVARGVFDVTSDPADAIDELAEDDDFNPDEVDEAELEVMLEADDGVDSESELPADDGADLVSTDLD